MTVVFFAVSSFLTPDTFLPITMSIIVLSLGLFGVLYVLYVRGGFSAGQALQQLAEDGVDMVMWLVFIPVILTIVSFGYFQHDTTCLSMLGGVKCPWFMTATIQLGLLVFGPLAIMRLISGISRYQRPLRLDMHFALNVLKTLPAMAMSIIFILVVLYVWK